MTRGRLCAKEVASVAKESALVFPFLWMCCKLKDLKPDYKLLTLLRYPCILVSRASNSPLTWPTISLEYENISIVFPPIFWTIEIPTNKVSYSASLFVAKKSNLKDFSIMIFFGDIRTSPTPNPLWFITPSTYTFQDKGSYRETNPIDFPSMFCFSTLSSNGVSANSATRSTRT